jgi:hypothetical protein
MRMSPDKDSKMVDAVLPTTIRCHLPCVTELIHAVFLRLGLRLTDNDQSSPDRLFRT